MRKLFFIPHIASKVYAEDFVAAVVKFAASCIYRLGLQ